MESVFKGIFIWSSVYLCLKGFMKMDKSHGMYFQRRHWLYLLIGSLMAGFLWQDFVVRNIDIVGAWFIVHIYFLSCAMMDMVTCQVYDLLQYPGIIAAAYLVLQSDAGRATGISLFVFSLLQGLVFRKLYGSADGMAFLTAALAGGSLGYEIEQYLLHMIVAYLLLAAVQIVKGNIGYRGRLKKPVPFLPYITIGFWWMLLRTR